MPKYSVKKPFTVVVAVIIVIILGAVAYTQTGIDLLPEMELPYVVVMTTYPGASPEEVESTVTRPLEEALATLSGMENISSVSAENYSMIMLQFASSTNMDSAMIEISSYIDLARADFPDLVGAPSMLRINPSMLPVMVMTADKMCIRDSLCPTQAIAQDDPQRTDAQRCILCMRCVSICPQQARSLPAQAQAQLERKLSGLPANKENEFFL